MKKSNVPQDIGPKEIEEIAYAVDEAGRYVKVPSIGWAPKNIANEQAWEVIEGELEEQLRLIRAGKRSPLAYHMSRNLMTVGLLASYMGLPRWRVKRHLKPGPFGKLDDEMLARYADLFEISVARLKTAPESAETGHYEDERS